MEPIRRCEWNADKARSNLRKHRVDFLEACEVFLDPLSVTIPDESHGHEEDRLVTIGHSSKRRLLVVVHTERGHALRIISARRATRQEIESYEKRIQDYFA